MRNAIFNLIYLLFGLSLIILVSYFGTLFIQAVYPKFYYEVFLVNEYFFPLIFIFFLAGLMMYIFFKAVLGVFGLDLSFSFTSSDIPQSLKNLSDKKIDQYISILEAKGYRVITYVPNYDHIESGTEIVSSILALQHAGFIITDSQDMIIGKVIVHSQNHTPKNLLID